MTLKTKDILKILKLVKKSKKAKKRRSKHKKKINITTQQIAPSTLQPYEISRQPFNNTNNIQLDNMRLSNKVLENKLIEPDPYNLKTIEDKINLTTSSISDINNYNKDLNEKLNRVITVGDNFISEAKRKFNNHELKLLEQDNVKLDSKNALEKTKEEKPDPNLSAVFDNPDDYFVDIINPSSMETFSLDNPIYKQKPTNPLSTKPFSLNRKASTTNVEHKDVEWEDVKPKAGSKKVSKKVEKNVEEQQQAEVKVDDTKNDQENVLNISNISKISDSDDKFVYKKIKNEKILRSLLKNIETKPTRKLTDEEKKLLKGFYKKNNVTWPANTQSTGGVKNQLHKFKL